MRTARRKVVDVVMRWACGLSTILLAAMLLIILGLVVREGIHSINLDFFIHLPTPVGIPGGGMGSAIAGSILVVALASAMGLPVGIMCGVYLSEYGANKFGSNLRFLIEVMNGVPTIVAGMIAYALIVVPLHTFSAYAGAVALAIIMIPLVSRATELVVRQVPQTWREASVALGASPARTILSVVLPGARAGIITAAMLAIARVAGETAPLLFTAFGNDVAWPTHPGSPTAVLPLQVFNYAMSPYDEWKTQAWGGALVLVAGVLVLNICVRLFTRADVSLTERM